MITTDRQIQALKAKATTYWEAVKSPHGGGLVVRVSTGGSRSWYVRYRFDHKQDAINIGQYPAMRLQDARDAHVEVRKLLAEGINPKRAQRQHKARNQAAWTMNQLFEAWAASYASTPSIRTKRPPSSTVVEQTHWRWDYYLKKQLGDFLAKSVNRPHITSVIAEVAETQSREQARKCLSLVKGMFDFAEARGQIEANPAAGIQPAKIGALPSRSRERHLDLPELHRLWIAIEQTRLAPSTAAALKFLILTGQRRGELLLAKWKHIDFDHRIWTIPAANAKNRKEHDVYLSDAALELLRCLPENREYLFESERVVGQPTRGSSITTAIMRIQGRKTRQRDEKAPLSDVEPFSVHDLRRSVATGLGEHCAVQPHVIERMLNHTSENKLIQTYQRSEYAAEQKAAWQAWGELIEIHVANDPGNVVAMRNTVQRYAQ